MNTIHEQKRCAKLKCPIVYKIVTAQKEILLLILEEHLIDITFVLLLEKHLEGRTFTCMNLYSIGTEVKTFTPLKI